MTLFSLDQLADTIAIVRGLVPPTPAYAWPLLARRSGVQVVVKHENHTPTGAFKARGVFVYVDEMRRAGHLPKGVVSATRGNHGQAVALAASRNAIPSIIVVPEGNSPEKNAAMEGFGAELIVKGRDFDESRGIAEAIACERGFQYVPSFHPSLVRGVASYAYELFSAHPDLDVFYVPIGMGSGICAVITVRDLLGLKTEIVGVVSEEAPAFALSFEAGRAVPTNGAWTFADGMACREPPELAVEIVRKGAARVLQVSEDEIAEAVRALYADTHNLAEGAGAAGFAALMKERDKYQGRRAGFVLSGANIDAPVLTRILKGETPDVRPASR